MLSEPGRPEHLSNPLARAGGDSGLMTVPHDEPHVKSDAGATEEATLPLDGGSIYVRQNGPRDAPALLLIHGSGSSTRTWDPMVPLLTTSHRVIRIDLLGHAGRTNRPTATTRSQRKDAGSPRPWTGSASGTSSWSATPPAATPPPLLPSNDPMW